MGILWMGLMITILKHVKNENKEAQNKIEKPTSVSLTQSPSPPRRRLPRRQRFSKNWKLAIKTLPLNVLYMNPVTISPKSYPKVLIEAKCGRTLNIENKVKSSSLGIKAQVVEALIPQPSNWMHVTRLKQKEGIEAYATGADVVDDDNPVRISCSELIISFFRPTLLLLFSSSDFY